jgi:hypothetical protein
VLGWLIFLDFQNKAAESIDYFNIDNENLKSSNDSQLAILRTIKKNSLNNKILDKRAVGGS